MRRPSTLMTAVSGSTRMPCSRTFLPSTSTRPLSIRISHARRLPTPAVAMTFCRRMACFSYCSVRGLSLSDIATDRLQVLGIEIEGVELGEIGGELRELVEAAQAEPLEEVRRGAVEDRAGLVLAADLLDEAAREQSAHHAVDVDPTNGGDATTAD